MQRTTHLFLVQAILLRQKSKTVGFEINQGIAHNQRPLIQRIVERNLAGDGTLNLDDIQPTLRCDCKKVIEPRRLDRRQSLAMSQNEKRSE
jgi:hypothetical protein